MGNSRGTHFKYDVQAVTVLRALLQNSIQTSLHLVAFKILSNTPTIRNGAVEVEWSPLIYLPFGYMDFDVDYTIANVFSLTITRYTFGWFIFGLCKVTKNC